MCYLDPDDEILKHGARLPHWQQGEVMQFVTFRLCDSMPLEKLRKWKDERTSWLKINPEPWTPEQEQDYHKRFTWRLEAWLDQGSGSCILKESANRIHLEEVLMHFQGDRVEHHAWVIMPNHVHLLFTPLGPIEKLIQAWKSVSARKIGKGMVWQANYRDTMIRDGGHFGNAVRYIRRNPAKLRSNTFTLWEGERALAVQ
jgi:putative transposase